MWACCTYAAGLFCVGVITICHEGAKSIFGHHEDHSIAKKQFLKHVVWLHGFRIHVSIKLMPGYMTMPLLQQQFGKRLRQLRRQRDITQEKLAQEADISVEFLSNLERGINAPSFETLERLATALEVSVQDLFNFNAKI